MVELQGARTAEGRNCRGAQLPKGATAEGRDSRRARLPNGEMAEGTVGSGAGVGADAPARSQQ